MSSIADSTPAERDAMEQFFEDRFRYAVVRGRARGHYYQLTADSIMLEHRPDSLQATNARLQLGEQYQLHELRFAQAAPAQMAELVVDAGLPGARTRGGRSAVDNGAA